jgi:pSer/pThr/pTyr-binding forkhead associated (FHA) protein
LLQLVVSLKGRPVGKFALDRPSLRIGRSPENEVQVDSQAVSRQHALIEKQGEGWTIRDLGSNNGTFLNGTKVVAEPQPLAIGDKIQLGPFDLAIVADAATSGSMPRVSKVPSRDSWTLPPINVRVTGADQDARERASTQRAFLILNNAPGPPRLIEKDLYQIGKDGACDLRLEGIFAPRKLALIVRGQGGWKLVNVTSDGKRVERNGAPVPDQCWLADGDRITAGEIELVFLEGMPTGDARTETTGTVRPPG